MLIKNALLSLGLAILTVAPACPNFPGATFSPTSLTFDGQVVSPGASPSAAQTITLTSSGLAALSIQSIDASGDFSQTNDCGTSLAAKASCSIQVSFSPNSIGAIRGAITLNSNALGKPHIVSLTGTGLPPVGFSPISVDFGNVSVNTTSAAKTISLTNNQGATLGIASVGVTGDYSQTNNCSSSLRAGQSCQISVKFKPTVAASVAGALNVSTDATPDAQPIALIGAGTGSSGSSVGFSSAALAFGNQEAGTTSAQKIVTLTNHGGSSLTIQSVGVSAGYTSTDDCSGKMLAPSATCSINVKFQPQADFAMADYPGAITVIDSNANSPQVVGLSGTAVAPISSGPATLDFGQVLGSSTSASQGFTLTNNHASSETLSVTPSGGFSLSNDTCSNSTVSSGSKCHADASFTSSPSGNASGPVSGAITVTPSSGGFLSPQVVNLQACVTRLVVSPTTFNFGAVAVGSSSKPETMTLSGQSGAFNVSAVSVTGVNAGDFAISNNTCSGAISDSCTLDVTYTPQASGARSATVSVTDDDGCSPHQQQLSGGSSAGLFIANVTVNGSTGNETVTSSPAGINCLAETGDCSAQFSSGTTVTLTANGSASQPTSHLSSWTGDCSGSSTCVLDMDSDKEVSATFASDPQLIVEMPGIGNGTVKSSPAGIDCEVPGTANTNCVFTFPVGTSVTLTATAASGSSFTGWSGGRCAGAGKCTFTSTADQTVTATFTSDNPPDFRVDATPLSPVSVSAGQSATSTLSVSAVNGFNSSVSLSCSLSTTVTAAPTCGISPSSVSPGSTAVLTANTKPNIDARASFSVVFATLLPFAGLMLVTSPQRKKFLKSWHLALLLGTGVVCLASMQIACGGASTKHVSGGGTPAGTYMITVSGTSGSTQHSTTVTLVVK